MTPRKIAVVGGECTGKTVLCQALAVELPAAILGEVVEQLQHVLKRVQGGSGSGKRLH